MPTQSDETRVDEGMVVATDASEPVECELDEQADNATVMEMLNTSAEGLRRKIVELTAALTEVEGLKKSSDKGFNDQIKDIKTEIKMTLDLLKKQEGERG